MYHDNPFHQSLKPQLSDHPPKPPSVKMDCSREEVWMANVQKPRRCAAKCYVIARLSELHTHGKRRLQIHATKPQNIIELVSLTVDGRPRGQTEQANARYSGEGEASDASRFPAFIHAYGRASSITPLPRIINPQITHPKEGTPSFHNLSPCPQLRCRVQSRFNTQHFILSGRFSALTIASYEQTPF